MINRKYKVDEAPVRDLELLGGTWHVGRGILFLVLEMGCWPQFVFFFVKMLSIFWGGFVPRNEA